MQGGVSVVTLSSAEEEEAQFGFRLELPCFTADMFKYLDDHSRVSCDPGMRSGQLMSCIRVHR